MLVFAANGVWFITGSTGIGFSATDYTITKISAVRSISSTSFVDVNGLPAFWNEEGIYMVIPAQQGLGLSVDPLTLGTILTFYKNIPLDSKKYVRGAYNPVTYIIEWVYRSTDELDVTTRYQYDSLLCLNIYTKAFYPFSISGPPHINGITYVASPGGTDAPDPTFKYFCSAAYQGTTTNFTFAEEYNTDYLDWFNYDNVGTDYISYFVTGYSLHGQGQRLFQPGYVYIYSRNSEPNGYVIQGIWNFASSGDSGKYSTEQVITNNKPNFGMVYRRHRIRGHGTVFQMKISSQTGLPFDIMGWSLWETQTMSI